jgi:sugar lactone lactonase YvrE
MRKVILSLLSLSLILGACKEDDKVAAPIESPRRAIIGIEGVSPNGISSLAYYNIASQTVENNVFRKSNINPLGAQLNDMMIDEERGRLVLVVPGSDKLVFTSLNDLTLEKQHGNLMQIKNIAQTSADEYYISSWEIDGVYVLNANNGNVKKEVLTEGAGPTGILVHNDLAFITNTGAFLYDSTVTILRTSEDTIVTKLLVGGKPNSMVVDAENNLWVLNGGKVDNLNPFASGVGSLFRYQLDTLTMAIDSGWVISPDTVMYFTDNLLKPHSLTINPEGNEIFYIGNSPTGSIFRMSTFANKVQESPLIMGNYYNLAFDETELELYAMRIPDNEDQDGDLQIYNPAGNLKTSIKIGVKPKNVVFK